MTAVDKAATKLRGKTPVLLVLPTFIHFCLFFIAPLCLLLVYSFYRFVPGGAMEETFVLENYAKFILDPYYRGIVRDTILLGAEVAFFTLILGYPLAYKLARTRSRFKGFLYLLVVMPLLTSAVVRTYGWMVILSRNGIVNSLLLKWGFIEQPLRLMYNRLGVVIGLTEVLLPFMTLALESVLRNMDPALEEAAHDLGANSLQTFLRVTLPLSLPGVATGSVLVFIMAISAFVTPTLMGGPQVRVLSTVVYEQALSLVNWPFSAAVAFTLLALVGVLIFVYNKLLISGKSWEVAQ
ncbi:MAG: ABC transporter permease [Bacillota bacterium]|nr:ABC transporter permease [Bacillota bacterium]